MTMRKPLLIRTKVCAGVRRRGFTLIEVAGGDRDHRHFGSVASPGAGPSQRKRPSEPAASPICGRCLVRDHVCGRHGDKFPNAVWNPATGVQSTHAVWLPTNSYNYFVSTARVSTNCLSCPNLAPGWVMVLV